MSKMLDVGIRITADGRVLVAQASAAKNALASLADTAKRGNNESAAAAERFTSSLKRQADTLGMTAMQVRAYDAAQLKLNEAQRASVEASNRAISAYEAQQSAAKSNIDIMGGLRSQIGAVAAAYVSYNAVLGGARAVIDTALANERLNNTLKVGVGSAEAAAQEISFLRQESERLGLQFAVVSGQYAKLTVSAKGTKLEGQATRDIFLAMAQASAVLGLSTEQTGRAFVAVQQMMNKGKVTAEEFTGQLSEAMPGALQAAASGMDLTERELLDLMATGKLATDRLIPALTRGFNEMFSAQAQESARGLNAKINRLENSFTDLKTAIGNTGLLDLLSSGIVLATRFVDALSGAKVLSAVDAQKQKIIEMRAELESLGNRKHIPLIGDLLFDKKQADLLSQRIDDGIQDLKKLEQAALTSAEALSGKKAVTPGTKPELPKEWADAAEKAEKARKKEIEDSEKAVAALKRETAEIGLNVIQRKMLAASIDAAKAPNEALKKQIMAEAAAYGQLALQQEQVAANKKFIEEQSKALINLGNSQTKQLRQQLEDLRAQNALIGLTRDQVIAMAGAKERETAAVIRNAAVYAGDMHDAYISYANDLEATGNLQQQLMQEQEVKRYAQAWNQTWSSIEQTGKQAFIQFAAHGKSAMQSIGDAIKTSLFDLLYQLTIRKWVINIGTSLESSFVGAAGANAASSGMSALNAASLASNGLGLLKSGFGATSLLSSVGSYLPGSAGSFFAGMGVTGTQAAAQAGASALWGASGASTAASMGASFASVAGPAIAIAAVDQITRLLAGDKLIGGGVGKVLNYVPVLGPLLNGLFGRGPLKQRGTSLTGEIGAEGFESGQLQTRFVASGGLFRSDKTDFARVDMTGQTWTDNRKLQGFADDLAKTAREVFGLINDTTKQTSSSLRQIGKDLGVSTEGIDKFGYSINLLSDKGKMLSEEQIGKEIEKITDGLARSLLPQVDELAKRGETALQTVSRLGTEFNSLVDAASLILGKSAADAKAMISGTTFQGRTAFVDAAGGTDALGQKAAFYSQNFYSSEELLTQSQTRLGEQLQALGLSSDLTKDQFKGLVESFGQVNGISESLLQSLLNLAPAFVSVRNAQDQLVEQQRQQAAQVQQERLGLETQLLQLQSNTAELRNRELAALDPANRELQQRIYLIEDERAAVQKNRDAAATAFGALQKAVGAEKDKITKDYNEALTNVNGHIDSVTQSIGKLKSLSDALKATASQIVPMTRDAAKRQIMDAISTGRSGGSLPEADSLREALSTLGRGAPGFAGSFEYAREQAKTALLVADLGKVAGDQLTLDERSLAALEAQRTALTEGFERQIAGLDGMLTQGQAQIDALNGINAGVLTLAEAIGQFNAASVAAGGATIGTTRSGITYQQIRDFANTPGRTGMEIYNAADKNGVGFVDYAAATGKNITDLYAWADARGLPRFAKGGFHRGGLRIVGENGPELEMTGPASIASNNDLSKLLNNDDVVQQLLALIALIGKNNEYNERVADKLDAVTQGGTTVRTRNVA
ncbi:tape measure protein [Nitrosomonas oligotropha]|uniref:tape measure protein n=1 Tax=Nitrosomonas oligotropha TaxID=42354 RepID=UPI00136F25B7|nr:tape measure protein [Nitrosomonas oligotropha]MXS82278.1 hypothetical protein [Nitrosomonas oligotropha]